MKQAIMSLILTVAASLASAQTPYPDPYLYPSPPWCPTCYMAGAVDVPSSHSNPALAHTKAARLPYGQWYVAGWGFVCQSGQLPNRIELAYRADDGSVVWLKDTWMLVGLYRPDVRAAYAKTKCAAPDASGFHVYFGNQQVPVGTRDLYITIWREGLLHARHLVVTVE